MKVAYKDVIRDLVVSCPFPIDPDIQLSGRAPSMASSQFLTNKEQGEWAEEVVLRAINDPASGYVALKAGRSDSISADDPRFPQFFAAYQAELNDLGKRPDILVYESAVLDDLHTTKLDDATISRATAAIEVRSSSFLATKYNEFTSARTNQATRESERIRRELTAPPFEALLLEKAPGIHEILANATPDTLRDLSFRSRRWSSSQTLRDLSDRLRELKAQLALLQKRDHLSITPKLEDIALVDRWIQRYDVPHFYLQVFFDKAYIISFKSILQTISDPSNEGEMFSVEEDVKNQHKTTFKVDLRAAREIIGRIDMPDHHSEMRELNRGRLLFYVSFTGGKGYLDLEVFMEEVIGAH
ncbi:MAG: AccI family restriction endonuclease [Gammaproteobacteria bacterium]|nr:AccI family restriction endonuclease [Gammaproteobacteria bacterium]